MDPENEDLDGFNSELDALLMGTIANKKPVCHLVKPTKRHSVRSENHSKAEEEQNQERHRRYVSIFDNANVDIIFEEDKHSHRSAHVQKERRRSKGKHALFDRFFADETNETINHLKNQSQVGTASPAQQKESEVSPTGSCTSGKHEQTTENTQCLKAEELETNVHGEKVCVLLDENIEMLENGEGNPERQDFSSVRYNIDLVSGDVMNLALMDDDQAPYLEEPLATTETWQSTASDVADYGSEQDKMSVAWSGPYNSPQNMENDITGFQCERPSPQEQTKPGMHQSRTESSSIEACTVKTIKIHSLDESIINDDDDDDDVCVEQELERGTSPCKGRHQTLKHFLYKLFHSMVRGLKKLG